jgi:DNA-binding NtrC family response regulator
MAKILIVDDDQDIRDSVKMVLGSKSHEVLTAQNVDEARKIIDSEKLDLILLDIMMDSPDDGIVLAHEIKKRGLSVPIIMLSGVAQVTGYEYGKCDEVLPCAEFLEKPITPEELLKKVEQVLSNE